MSPMVTVMKTSPETVVEDYGHLLRAAGYSGAISVGRDTVLDISIPWDVWFPGCSTAPWQLEGVAKALLEDGFDPASLRPAESGCGHMDPRKGERNNGLTVAAASAGLGITCLEEPPVEWVRYQPRADLPVLRRYCPDGILVPDFYPGSNMISLPAMRTSAMTVVAGAIESAMAAFLRENESLRRPADESPDELLADLLELKLEMHEGIFTVADGVFCSDGPGPFYLRPYEKGYIAAGADPVAVDAVTARMMGFEPMSISHIRLAHERGLGCGDPAEIKVVEIETGKVAADAAETSATAAIDFRFRGVATGVDQLFEMVGSTLPATAGRLWRDDIWYPWIGWSRLNQIAESAWGQRFQEYLPPDAALDRQGKGKAPLLAAAAALFLGAGALSRMGRRG